MATVIWNQLAAPFEYNVWETYNSNKASVTFNSRIATVTYLAATYGDGSSIRQTSNNVFSSNIGELFYVSVMMNPSFDASFYMELSGTTDRDGRVSVSANTWARYSKVAIPTTDKNRTDAKAYIGIYSSSANDTAQFKSPIIISLTKMYGAGNEPTAAEFERQCALNGIDLTQYHPRDSGTPRHWITTENKRLQTARSGNTVDSEDIAHFVTNCAMPLRSCKVEIEPSLAGYDSIELDYRGRNLLINIATPGNSVFTLNSDGSVSANGTVSGESWFIWNSSLTGTRNSSTQYVQTRLLPNGRYFLAKNYYVDDNHQSKTYPRYSLNQSNYDGTNERKGTHCQVDSEGCMVVDDTYKYNWMRIYESKANTYSNYTFYPQTYLASEPNRTWEPCNWRKFTVNFDNKIYGGTLDLVSGKLVVDVGCVDLGDLTWQYADSNLRFFARDINSLVELPPAVRTGWGLCSGLTVISDGRSFDDVPDNSIYLNTNGSIMIHLSAANKDPTAVGPLVSGIKYVYKLANPITYQLTPQEITTLLGVNNVWCNDGKVTLQYYANSPTQDSTDMFERRRLAFVANSPHLQQAESGNTGYNDYIARFKTNLTLPVKEAIVSILPQQQGSGAPSPSNPRVINGIDNIKLTTAGVNLLECDTYSDVTNRHGLNYTGFRNSDGQIESISISGTTTQSNCFLNLNYQANRVALMPGVYSSYSYAPQVQILPGFDYEDGSSPGAPMDIETREKYTEMQESKWRKYNVLPNLKMSLARLNTVPYQSNLAVNTTVQPLLCLPQDEGCEFEPYKGINYSITLPTTIYEGILNLITGELTVNYKLYTFTGEETELKYGWDGMFLQVSDSISDNGLYIIKACSHTNNLVRGVDIFNTSRGNAPDTTELSVCAAGSAGSQLRFRNRDLDPDYTRDIELYKTWLRQQYAAGTPLQMVYQLQTPLVYQLTPLVIRTFRGVNNIWANRGTVKITYWTDPYSKIDSPEIKLFRNNAVYESGNGSIVNYVTDNDYYIAGPFDTGDDKVKTYTCSCITNPRQNGAFVRLFDNSYTNSIDYWSLSWGGQAERTFESAGRYVYCSVCKAYADTSYMYYTVNGVRHYLFKGAGVP